MSDSPSLLPALFDAQRRRLWGLAYRLTASTDDADDIVQESFARLLEQPPPAATPLGPWLARVATHLGIDALRRRRRRAYPGPWLPSPVEAADEDWLDTLVAPTPDPAARYDLLESATIAFLIALEALSPRQRAVLLLRDVLGYTARDVAAMLATSEGNVRLLHLRARRQMAAYDQRRCIPDAPTRARHAGALQRFAAALASQDSRAVEALLLPDVHTVTDAGGEYTAVSRPLVGPSAVARLYLRAANERAAAGPRTTIGSVNGLPALIVAVTAPVRRQAPRSVVALSLTDDDRIAAIHTILASRKLARVSFPPA